MKKWLFLICGILCCLLPACKQRPAQPAIYALTSPLSAIPTPQYSACPLRDDVAWQTWSVPPSRPSAVRALAVDEQQVWFSDSFGTYRLDTQTGAYTRYPKVSAIRFFLLVGEGRLWAVNEEGFLYFDGQAWSQPTLKNPYTTVASALSIDRWGNLWSRVSPIRGTPIFAQYRGHIPPKNRVWKPSSQSSDGWDVYDCGKWQAFAQSGLTYHSNQECRQLRETAQQVRALSWKNVFAANGQDLWWVTADGRLLHATGGVTQSIAIPADEVYVLAADPDRGVWAGTSQGLFYADEAGVHWFEQTPNADFCALPGRPLDIVVDTRGDVWLITSNGLLKLPHGEAQWEIISDTKVSDADRQRPVLKIAAAPDGGIWATHGWDLWKFNETVPTAPPHLDPSCHFDSMAIDAQNTVWVTGSKCEVWQYLPSTGTWIEHYPNDAGQLVTSSSNGVIYVVRNSNVFMYDNSPGSERGQSSWKQVTPKIEQVGEWGAVDSQGGLWINMLRSGQILYAHDGQQTLLESPFPDPVYGLQVDHQNQLWLYTGSNLAVYDGKQIITIPMPLEAIDKIAFGPDGRVWIKGESGVVVYNPNAASQP